MKKILIFIFCLFLFSIVNAEEKEDLAPDAKSAIMIEASTGEILFQKCLWKITTSINDKNDEYAPNNGRNR